MEWASTGSRLATGSSARIMRGCCMRARAMPDPLLLPAGQLPGLLVRLFGDPDAAPWP